MKTFVATLIGLLIIGGYPRLAYGLTQSTKKQYREEHPDQTKREYEKAEKRTIMFFIKTWYVILIIYLIFLVAIASL